LDIVKLSGTTAAVGKTVANLAASTESAAVTFANFSGTGVGTIAVAGVTITQAAGTALTAANIVTVLTGGTVSGLTMSGTLTGYTVAAGTAGQAIFTSTTSGTNVSDLAVSAAATLVVTGTGAAASALTVAQGGVAYAGVAHNIVFDTAANLGLLGVNIGNHSTLTSTSVLNYAVASDTGAIYYDADGNWTTSAVKIGSVGTQTLLAAATDFTVA
jgi:hypothetical protein